jgi:TetR/AcrR family transcriptional regulator, transcriptional repressor of bet genes
MRQDGRRHEGCERRRQLIEATIMALAKHGSGKVSVRLIASEAQASPGLVTHHFGSIDALIAAAAGQLGRMILDVVDQAVEDGGDNPRLRLMGLVEGCFRPPILSATTVGAWLAVTALAQSMPLVADVQRGTIDRLRERIGRLMSACAPDRAHRLPATALAAVIEGLWMEMARDTGSVTADEAARITLHWLRSLGLFRADDQTAEPAASRQGFAWEPRLRAGRA